MDPLNPAAVADPSKLLGRLPSPDDHRDYSVMALAAVADAITAPLPVRYKMATVTYMGRYNQQESSCVGHSVTFAKVIQERRQRAKTLMLNPLWLWHQSKVDDGIGQPDSDRGTYIRTALEVLRNVGHTEASDPTNRGLAEPDTRIAAYYRVDTVEQLKAAIHTGGMVILGQDWYPEWFSTPASGILPQPGPNIAGGHATGAYGWDDEIPIPWDSSVGGIWAVNSWSAAFGRKGDYLIPYSLFGAGKPVDEAWRIQDAA